MAPAVLEGVASSRQVDRDPKPGPELVTGGRRLQLVKRPEPSRGAGLQATATLRVEGDCETTRYPADEGLQSVAWCAR